IRLALTAGAEGRLQVAPASFRREEFLEEERVPRDGADATVLQDRAELVPQREKAGRLDADDRHAAGGPVSQGSDEPRQLLARLADEARAEEGPPAAQGARGVVLDDGVSAGLEDR